MCVCVCVCVWERKREGRRRKKYLPKGLEGYISLLAMKNLEPSINNNSKH